MKTASALMAYIGERRLLVQIYSENDKALQDPRVKISVHRDPVPVLSVIGSHLYLVALPYYGKFPLPTDGRIHAMVPTGHDL